MTCIVAITDGTKVYMGGDSAAAEVESQFVSARVEPKVFIRGEFIIGYAGSFRFGKLVEHIFEFPDPAKNIEHFMNTEFINSLRECAEENKVDVSEDKDAGELLIGIRGEIYEFNSDWHVGKDINNFNAIGSGASYALGSLFSSKRYKDPYARINLALEASEAFSPFVRRPFTLLEL